VTLREAGPVSGIAATTALIWRLLDRELRRSLPGVKVNACPPDNVRTEAGGRQLNLFLYQVIEDAGRRDPAPPGGGPAPLVVALRYLISAYGEEGGDVDLSGQEVLEAAMDILHRHAVIAAGPDARAAARPLHLALVPVALDDMARLWANWSTPYRTSVVYEASPVVVAAPGPERDRPAR
jgi:hypothetical protein